MSQQTEPRPRGRLERLRGRRMLGGFMVAGGAVGLAAPLTDVADRSAVAGGMFLLAAVATFWMAATDRDNRRSVLAWQGALGFFLLAIGGMLVTMPPTGDVPIAVPIGAATMALGLVRVVLSLTRRRGWIWMALAGGLSLVLGTVLLLGLAGDDRGLPGRLLSVDLVVAGVALMLAGPGRRLI